MGGDDGKSTLWRHANPESTLVIGARQRARELGVPCTITKDDVEIPERCPLLGVALKRDPGPRRDNSPTLDRIVPVRGYVPGNVWVLSDLANRMKSNATREQLVTFARNVLEIFDGDGDG
jgi:hypothetical protein